MDSKALLEGTTNKIARLNSRKRSQPPSSSDVLGMRVKKLHSAAENQSFNLNSISILKKPSDTAFQEDNHRTIRLLEKSKKESGMGSGTSLEFDRAILMKEIVNYESNRHENEMNFSITRSSTDWSIDQRNPYERRESEMLGANDNSRKMWIALEVPQSWNQRTEGEDLDFDQTELLHLPNTSNPISLIKQEELSQPENAPCESVPCESAPSESVPRESVPIEDLSENQQKTGKAKPKKKQSRLGPIPNINFGRSVGCVICGNLPPSLDVSICSIAQCQRMFCKSCIEWSREIHHALLFEPGLPLCAVCKYQSSKRPYVNPQIWHMEFKDAQG